MQPLLPLPGPKAKAIIERDQLVISPSYPRDYPFVMDHGKGTHVWDVDGNRYLDFAVGLQSPQPVTAIPKLSRLSRIKQRSSYTSPRIIITNPGLHWGNSWRELLHSRMERYLS